VRVEVCEYKRRFVKLYVLMIASQFDVNMLEKASRKVCTKKSLAKEIYCAWLLVFSQEKLTINLPGRVVILFVVVLYYLSVFGQLYII
jgi:hypothetical protein